MSTSLRYTIHDIALLPDNGNRYEIIDGDLHVSKQPHWRHQFTCDQFGDSLRSWNNETRLGIAISAPGVIFAVDEAVAPDLVWVSRERFFRVVGDDGTLHLAPDLVVEVLSPGPDNEER